MLNAASSLSAVDTDSNSTSGTNMSYLLKVDVQQRKSAQGELPSEARPSPSRTTSASNAVNLASDYIAFSAGNPCVEHLTGAVHLYRDMPPADAAARPAWTQPVSCWWLRGCMCIWGMAV